MGWAGGGTAPGLFRRRRHFIVTELEEVFVMKAELGRIWRPCCPWLRAARGLGWWDGNCSPACGHEAQLPLSGWVVSSTLMRYEVSAQKGEVVCHAPRESIAWRSLSPGSLSPLGHPPPTSCCISTSVYCPSDTFTAIITLGTWEGDRGVVNTLIVQRRKLRSRNKILHVASHQWYTQMGTLIPPLWYSSPPRCLLWERPPGSLTLTVTLWAGPCGLITSSEAGPLLGSEFTSENPTPHQPPPKPAPYVTDMQVLLGLGLGRAEWGPRAQNLRRWSLSESCKCHRLVAKIKWNNKVLRNRTWDIGSAVKIFGIVIISSSNSAGSGSTEKNCFLFC